VFPGFTVHDELLELVKAGLTPTEALRSATWNSAAFLRQAGEFGSVQAGKAADIVLLDADPLADIVNTRRIFGVVLKGRYLDRDALDQLLAGAERAAATQ
jgi:imidazolonepropionase-like amidohydrolase